MKQVILKKSDEWLEIGFNPERPYLRIHRFELLGDNADNNFINLHFSCRGKTSNQGEYSQPINAQATGYKREVLVNTEIDLNDAVTYEMKYISNDENLIDPHILVEYEDFKPLDTKNPTIEFKTHLEKRQNTKILFSAPFGQGKTTFLSEYFKEEHETYEVFKVFPVNYSIASNEDIFRYIKADLLFQLIKDKSTAFEKMEVSFRQIAPKYAKKNFLKILTPFLMLVPGIGKDIYDIYEKLAKVHEEISTQGKEESRDEGKESNNFLQELKEKEGSIFEENLITKIIQRQIDFIAKEHKKKTVLIIDDLDRVDPEHTFRILNVISAHYDSFHSSNFEESNKFGFDKIILVCDIQNIRYTFEHRFGVKVNFTGYISKFFSTAPFLFDNKKMMLTLLNEIDDISPQLNPNSHWSKMIYFVLEPLIVMDLIALRDLYNLKSIGIKQFYEQYRKDQATPTFHFNRGLLTPIIKLLSMAYDLSTIISIYEEYEKKTIRLYFGMSNDLAFPLIATLANKTESSYVYSYDFKSKGLKLRFGLDTESNFNYTTMEHIEIRNENGEIVDIRDVHIQFSDFCFLVIENIQRYIAMRS